MEIKMILGREAGLATSGDEGDAQARLRRSEKTATSWSPRRICGEITRFFFPDRRFVSARAMIASPRSRSVDRASSCRPYAKMPVDPESTLSRGMVKGPSSTKGRFRFSFASDEPASPTSALFRRWEALGLLMLVALGAAFIPGTWGAPPAAFTLVAAAARGETETRLLSLAPPLLAAGFAWRASGRLARSLGSFTTLFFLVTLSSLAVYIAFQLGLVLALRTSHAAMPSVRSLWQSTLPGAALGWAALLVIAALRALRGRGAGGRPATCEPAKPSGTEKSTREPGP
jgi:hypothetical protein